MAPPDVLDRQQRPLDQRDGVPARSLYHLKEGLL